MAGSAAIFKKLLGVRNGHPKYEKDYQEKHLLELKIQV